MKTLPKILITFSISKKPHLKVIKDDLRAFQIAKLQTEIKKHKQYWEIFSILARSGEKEESSEQVCKRDVFNFNMKKC